VDGAMSQSPMKMDMKVPDVPISEMTHSTVVINMIPPPAPQDGLVMRLQANVLWPTQVMASEVNQPVKLTAMSHQPQDRTRHLDATLPTTSVKHVIRVMKDAPKTNQLPAQTARIQTQIQTTTNVTELIQIIQNVVHAKKGESGCKSQQEACKSCAPKQKLFECDIKTLTCV